MSTFLKSAEKLLEIMTDAELEAEFSMIEEWLVSVKHVLLGTHGIDNVVLRSRFRFRQEEQELMYGQGFPGQTKVSRGYRLHLKNYIQKVGRS